MTPATLNEKTVAAEMLAELAAAIALPADDVVYTVGTVKMQHRPATRIRCECVLVEKYGVLWRRICARGKWQNVEQVNGSL